MSAMLDSICSRLELSARELLPEARALLPCARHEWTGLAYAEPPRACADAVPPLRDACR